MFLDLYQGDETAARTMAPNEGHDLPATFTDTFDTAWSESALFGQSISQSNARHAAIGDYVERMNRISGKQFDTILPDSGDFDLDALKAHVDKLRVDRPDLNIDQLTDDSIDQMAVEKSRAARDDYARMAQREKTFGGKLGTLAGGLAGAAADPINILALPAAPAEGLGVLATALRWGAIAATSQAAIEAAGGGYRERVQPGYAASGEPLMNVVEAFGGGAFIGGSAKVIGNAWTKLKTGDWPRSVRDAGNVAESEANTLNTGVYPGVDGEVAHREALTKTIDDVANGRPVDVSGEITPEIAAAREQQIDAMLGSRSAAIEAERAAKADRAAADTEAAPGLPFQQTALEAESERQMGGLADSVQDLARTGGYLMPRDEAATIAGRIAKASDEDARRLIDEVSMRPRTLADTLPKAERPAKPAPDSIPDESRTALADQLTPEAIAKQAAEPELDETVLRDLDRLRVERGDMKIPVGEEINAAGEREAVHRNLEDVLDEADRRMAAAKEIADCAGPYPEEAAE